MNIQTKFKNGDVLFTIEKKNLKIRKFEVGSTHTSTDSEGVTNVSYHAKGDSAYADNYDERYCFATKEELLAYIEK